MDHDVQMAMKRARAWRRVVIAGMVGAAAMVAWAIPSDSNGATACVVTASMSASPASISLGQSTTINWNIQWPPASDACEPASLHLYFRDATTGVPIATGVAVGTFDSTGMMVVAPPSSGSYSLHVLFNNSQHVDSGSATVNLALPVVNGKRTVDITQPNQNGLFAQAIGIEKAVVRIAGTLDLDLSGMHDLQVAPGVQILGDRTAVRAGPRLFTTTFPNVLLNVGPGSDHVRISGIRLDGGESDDPFSAVGTEDASGIVVNSSLDVQIDHNEIYRWRGSAVRVVDGNNQDDPAFVGRINRDNADNVWVHDNYIHHNQHPASNVCNPLPGHSAGYGVETADGAYALIERNVFDWNRHSISGDGRTGTGYLAYRNLILTNGGVHFRCPDLKDIGIGLAIGLVLNPFAGAVYIIAEALDHDLIYHTHAIDMHARKTCHNGVFVGDSPDFSNYNCGPAGEYMDIEFNTVLYIAGNGIHLRGTPAVGMDVKHNVFAHQDKDGGYPFPGAMVQNETGLHQSDNLFGLNTFNDRRSCDFDGDGISDPFIATGVTFWYSSSVLGGRWVFLGQSPARVDEVFFGDFDGDGRCDVSARGQVFLNPDPLPFARTPGHVSTLFGTPAALNLSATGGSRPYSWAVTGLPPGLSANAAGQISGTPAAGAAPFYLVTATVRDVHRQIGSATIIWEVTASVPSLLGTKQSEAQSLIAYAGLTFGGVSYSDDCVDPGDVIAQHPIGGGMAPVGSSVHITVSTCTSRSGGGGGGGPILTK